MAVERVKVMKLTKRQKEILDFITEFIQREGYSPSMEEIASHFGFASLNAVFKHLASLEVRGHLRRDARRARSIELAVLPGLVSSGFTFLGLCSRRKTDRGDIQCGEPQDSRRPGRGPGPPLCVEGAG